MKEELSATDAVAVAVVPASQPDVVAEARRRAKRTVSAGIDAGDLQPRQWSIAADGRGVLALDGVDVKLPLRGLHNLRNAMLAYAVAREAGISTEDFQRGIEAMAVPPMRSNVEDHGRVTLINDAYNSNPGSARAAIELLEHAGKGRQRVAVLGTMLELGTHTPQLHDDVARTALDAGIEIVAGLGEFADALARIAPADSRAVVAPDIDALWSALSSRLAPDAVILLKGSRGMRLERLVTPIAEWSRNRAST
jgi:UDP-N-acetylmuramoyl-tripeptide--D-alanyl-D-alanine ligase